MNKLTIITALLVVLSLNLFAQDDRRFYLMAKEDRVGSLSSHLKNEKGIYLRWDVLDGKFPSDIATLELIREDSDGDKLLLSVHSDSKMSSKEIAKLFQKPEAQRDLYRVIEQISHSNDAECSQANITNIGEKVSACLANDFWAYSQEKDNFYLAMADHKAFIDRSYDSSLSSISYKLIGKSSSGAKSLVLGKVEVSVGVTLDALAATEFKQKIESVNNDNRYGLDDFRVGLTWKSGAENASEAFVNSLMSSGYDLYYSTEGYTDTSAESWARGIDIKALAAGEAHNAKGEVSLLPHKLQKANSVTLLNSPYYETQQELRQRGFKPGEIRYYFLVSKDFTGNYGKTVFTKVVIPDLLPPPPPSNILVYEKDVSTSSTNVKYEATLKFDTVSLQNYMASHKGLKVCATETIDPHSRVRFVDKNESCDSKRVRVVNFNVAEYYIYRFENSAIAAGFEDLDLDGNNDRDGKSYLASRIPQTSQKSIEFSDTTVKRGKAYWYRVVSATPSGVISNMSAPIEAFISKRESFELPKVSASYKELEIIKERKSTITRVVAQESVGVSDRVRLEFREGSFDLPFKEGIASLSSELAEKLFENRPSGSIKVSFMKDSAVVMSKYVDVNDIFFFRAVYEEQEEPEPVEPGGFQIPILPSEMPAPLGYKINTIPKYLHLQETLKTLVSGDSVVGGCVDLKFDEVFIDAYKGKACLQTSLKIGTKRYLLEKDCELTTTKEICNETLNSEMVSVGVKFIMDSGSQTPEVHINYVPVKLDEQLPYTPVLQKFALDTNNNSISVKLQPLLQRVSGTMLEFYKQNSDEQYTKFVELLGGSKKVMTVTMDEAALSVGDTWCVKAKNIGLNNQFSEWSDPICSDIKSADETIDSLSWPSVNNRVKRVIRDLNATFNPLFKQIEITLDKRDISGTANITTTTVNGDYSNIIARDYVLSSAKTLELEMIEEGKSPLDQTVLKRVNIPKFFDYFILPKSAISSRDVARVNRLKFTFRDKDSQQVGDVVSVKKAGILSYQDSKVTLYSSVHVDIRSELTNRECILTPLLDKYTNYVVYRQVLGSTAGESDGNFVQVSPLIERSTCTKDGYKFSNNLISYTINNTTRVVKFVDRYPYEIGKKYRYIFLFFDENGEPQSYSLTNPDVVETH